MQIDTVIELRGNVYHVETHVSQLTPREQELISQFGGPIIETGGAISETVTRPGESAAVVAFTLPSAPRRLPDEFPAKYVVSLDDDEDADVKAQAWKQEIETRLITAKAALLVQAANFVGSYRQTI